MVGRALRQESVMSTFSLSNPTLRNAALAMITAAAFGSVVTIPTDVSARGGGGGHFGGGFAGGHFGGGGFSHGFGGGRPFGGQGFGGAFAPRFARPSGGASFASLRAPQANKFRQANFSGLKGPGAHPGPSGSRVQPHLPGVANAPATSPGIHVPPGLQPNVPGNLPPITNAGPTNPGIHVPPGMQPHLPGNLPPISNAAPT